MKVNRLIAITLVLSICVWSAPGMSVSWALDRSLLLEDIKNPSTYASLKEFAKAIERAEANVEHLNGLMASDQVNAMGVSEEGEDPIVASAADENFKSVAFTEPDDILKNAADQSSINTIKEQLGAVGPEAPKEQAQPQGVREPQDDPVGELDEHGRIIFAALQKHFDEKFFDAVKQLAYGISQAIKPDLNFLDAGSAELFRTAVSVTIREQLAQSSLSMSVEEQRKVEEEIIDSLFSALGRLALIDRDGDGVPDIMDLDSWDADIS